MWKLLKEAIQEWKDDKASMLAAALSFYTMISMAPLLVLATALVGLFYGEEAASGSLAREMTGMVGREAAHFMQDLVKSASRPAEGLTATVVSVCLLLFGASNVFGALKDALNTIWDVEPTRVSYAQMARNRAKSILLVGGVGLFLMASLVFTTALSGLTDAAEPLGQALNFLVSLVLFTVVFAALFKVLPDVHIEWSDVWHGAAFTSLLFNLGKLFIGLYLGHSTVGSSYGAAGALAVILIWVYYSAQILFLGAEFTQVYARRREVSPASGAVRPQVASPA